MSIPFEEFFRIFLTDIFYMFFKKEIDKKCNSAAVYFLLLQYFAFFQIYQHKKIYGADASVFCNGDKIFF